jgi:hypothetical protein
MKEFGFSDLHSFKDYVGFAKLCAPDDFPVHDWEDQLTLDEAFEGLRLGLQMSMEEKGTRKEFTRGQVLVEEAYAAYRDGNMREGFFKPQELQKLLRKVPSW